jgi:hypothetical protein
MENALKSNKDNEIKIIKILETTQAHELLTNTFYEAKLKWEGKMFFLATSSYPKLNRYYVYNLFMNQSI